MNRMDSIKKMAVIAASTGLQLAGCRGVQWRLWSEGTATSEAKLMQLCSELIIVKGKSLSQSMNDCICCQVECWSVH